MTNLKLIAIMAAYFIFIVLIIAAVCLVLCAVVLASPLILVIGLVNGYKSLKEQYDKTGQVRVMVKNSLIGREFEKQLKRNV